MSMSEDQQTFTRLLAQFLLWLCEQGYAPVLGEVARTKEQQEMYVSQGKSKTMNSKHINKLAADIALFKRGEYLTDTKDYLYAGNYWKNLDPRCKWGGDFHGGWDGNHFQFT